MTALGKSITTDSTLWTAEEEAEFIDDVLAQMKDERLDLWSMAVNFERRKRNQVDSLNLSVASKTAAKELKAAVDGEISHEPAPEDDAREVEDGAVYKFSITDREVHTHSFALRFSSDRTRSFLTVAEDQSRREHEIVINESHPLFDDLPPIDIATRTLLTRLALSLGAAEVFVESLDRKQVRTKMNQILQLVHPEPDDLPGEE